MSAAPVIVHAGIFVQSRLPMVLHMVMPSGLMTMNNIAKLEAAIIANLIYFNFVRISQAPMELMEIVVAGGVGAGLYHMAPP